MSPPYSNRQIINNRPGPYTNRWTQMLQIAARDGQALYNQVQRLRRQLGNPGGGSSRPPPPRSFNATSSRAAAPPPPAYSGYRVRGISTGFDKGNFSKGKKLSKTLESECLSKGYHITKETFGNVSDPHCVYLQHHTWQINEISRCLTAAIIREVFSVAGYPVNDVDRPLFLNSGAEGFGSQPYFRLVYEDRDPVSFNIVTQTLDINANNTFSSIIDSYGVMINRVRDYLRATSNHKPFAITLFTADVHYIEANRVVAFRAAGHIDLEMVHATIPVTSTVEIQNRTSGASASGTNIGSADRVDNQPVKGYMYHFKGADPRLKKTGPLNALNIASDLGISLWRAAVLGSSYQEPPVGQLWQNCDKKAKIMLNPGDIKKMSITHVYSGNLKSLMNKLRAKTWELGDPSYVSGIPGVSQMFALEEKIRTVTSNILVCSYEREVKVGAFIKVLKKKVPFVTELTTQQYDNNPS